ncbi:hypothetical protein BUALT_Bualt12G0047500 [Buddleja alternifolia]|uniref:Uncharacterized protein n=1 Tax=Buddleja alternifolia TaxID=168488 RepID=A0AAV6WVY3_9LAMI|nr:hypothetical protein BUALT_Bualt12G0047500 [Buddleja alternifolia]
MDYNSSIEESLLLSHEAEEKGYNLKAKIFEESKKIWRVATPSVISRVSSFGTIVVTQSFIGHISSVDLAGYALAQTLSVRFVNGLLVSGVAIGAGLQTKVGIINFICFYFIGVPIGAVLGYATKLQVKTKITKERPWIMQQHRSGLLLSLKQKKRVYLKAKKICEESRKYGGLQLKCHFKSFSLEHCVTRRLSDNNQFF